MKPDSLESDEESIELTVTEEDLHKYRRLDHLLRDKLEQYSRSFLKNLFEQGQITSNAKLDLKKIPPIGTKISIEIPPPIPSIALPENIPLEILYEDSHLIIVNKPAGMVTHPAPGNYSGTLVNAILYHCKDIAGIGNVKRPGIVHRLDKGTSGVMVVAKDQTTHEGLINLFSKHEIERVYETIILKSNIAKNGTIKSLIGRHPTDRLKMSSKVSNGKSAITHYHVMRTNEYITHLQVTLETGRTHQIRVHLAQELHSPILNDYTYAIPSNQKMKLPAPVVSLLDQYEHPLLHARHLGFIHPITKEKLSFSVEPNQIFQEILRLTGQQK